MRSVRKWLAATTAAAAVLAGSVVAASPAAAHPGPEGSVTGTGSTLLITHNLEGVSAPGASSGTSLTAEALGYRMSPTAGPRMYLSDEVLKGSFALTFILTHRDVPKFDQFKVRNTGSVPIIMVFTHEDEFNIPSTPADDSQLLFCLNQTCESGTWVPDTAVAPPVPLLALAPGEETEVTIGLKLAPNADWGIWNNRLRLSFLHFEAQAA